MKKLYSAPQLEEYGPMTELTLGAGGTEPDFQIVGGLLKNVNNNCLPTTSSQIACIVAS